MPNEAIAFGPGYGSNACTAPCVAKGGCWVDHRALTCGTGQSVVGLLASIENSHVSGDRGEENSMTSALCSRRLQLYSDELHGIGWSGAVARGYDSRRADAGYLADPTPRPDTALSVCALMRRKG